LSYILGDLVTRVQQRVRDTGFSSTEIKNYINDAQNDIFNEYRLPFMETTQAYTVAVGVSDITNGVGLPTNYVQALNLVYTSDGEKILPYRDIREVDSENPDPDDTDAGSPQYWYKYAGMIKVFPMPSSAYTLSLRYYKRPTVISADTAVPEVPSEFEEALVMGAAYRVMQVKDNYDQAGVLQNKFDEILQKLVMKYSQAQVGQPTIMRINRRGMGKAHF